MTIQIFPPSRHGVPQFETLFALQQDNWNDFGLQTQYHLYLRPSQRDMAPSLIGTVKILSRGQTGADGILIQESFEHLDASFCSVGASLDYYQRLNEIPPAERDGILAALRDVVASPDLQSKFRHEAGWEKSLFRDNPNPDEFLSDALAILTGNFSALPDLQLKVAFHPAHWARPLTLDFDSPEPMYFFGRRRRLGPSRRGVLLPRRLIAIIGRNGSGKSTLLSRIARVAFAAPSDRGRPEIQAIGAFEPASVGFTKIIAISYSAFDSFIVPGLYESELQQIASDIERGRGRYIYAGLRDIVAEVRDDVKRQQDTSHDDARALLTAQDRRTTTRLKSLTQLAEEFERLIAQIESNGDHKLLDAALEPLLADPSFADIDSDERDALLGPDPRRAFLDWSTGHKIALHVIASLVAHATRKSLILFDEPEMHLHPPLTAALMHALRIVLEERNAFSIIATHSPVILQETLARHVRVVRRTGDAFDIIAPGLETFGENVGTLTYDAFGLIASSTDYHRILDLLIEGFSSVDEINELFTPGLSGQALAYVMAGLARKGQAS